MVRRVGDRTCAGQVGGSTSPILLLGSHPDGVLVRPRGRSAPRQPPARTVALRGCAGLGGARSQPPCPGESGSAVSGRKRAFSAARRRLVRWRVARLLDGPLLWSPDGASAGDRGPRVL